MSKPLQWAIGISAMVISLSVAGLSYCASWALQQWGETGVVSNETVKQIKTDEAAVVYQLLRPCKGPDGPDACGTLAQFNKTEIKIGDVIAATQMQELLATPHITAAMDKFGLAADKLSGAAISLKGTADAGADTFRAATGTISEGKRTLTVAETLLTQLTANGASLQGVTDTLNDTLKRQAIGKLLDNAAGISSDFRTIVDKATADFIRPVPWWQQPIKKSGQLIDIGAAIARHTP